MSGAKRLIFHQSTGDPIEQVKRFTDWKADELIYLDITRDDVYDQDQTMNVIGSTSAGKRVATRNFVEVVEAVAKECFIPLTVGGKIRNLEDVRTRLECGADKVSINSEAIADPEFIREASRRFGRQCIVASVDVRYDSDQDKHFLYSDFGKTLVDKDPLAWCRELEELGAGEILLQSIDRDGMGEGYDLKFIKAVTEAVNIPVICLGGVGKFEHFVQGLEEGHASAVAAANIFHFTEQSIINAKKFMSSCGIDVRL